MNAGVLFAIGILGVFLLYGAIIYTIQILSKTTNTPKKQLPKGYILTFLPSIIVIFLPKVPPQPEFLHDWLNGLAGLLYPVFVISLIIIFLKIIFMLIKKDYVKIRENLLYTLPLISYLVTFPNSISFLIDMTHIF